MITPLTLVDFYPMLTIEDKELIIYLLKSLNHPRYNNLHLGSLALVDLKVVRKAVKSSKPYITEYTAFKSSRKRLRKRLSPDLLLQWRKDTERRQRHLNKMAKRAALKAMQK